MKVLNPPHGKWKYELDFLFLASEEADGMDPGEAGKHAATEIRKLLPKIKDEDLQFELRGVAEAFEDTVDSDRSFNSSMDELYEVADRECIWVKTF